MLYTTHDKPKSVGVTKEDENGGVTGIPEGLKRTQDYPNDFGQAIARLAKSCHQGAYSLGDMAAMGSAHPMSVEKMLAINEASDCWTDAGLESAFKLAQSMALRGLGMQ